jgi:hypothetical protein
MKRLIKSNSLEIQFWGYEVGNLFAAVAGSGGFARFTREINTVLSNPDLGLFAKFVTLSEDHPDAFVTIALGVVVLMAPLVRQLLEQSGSLFFVNLFAAVSLAAAALILLFTLNADTSWLTDAAAAFVVGSSLLRQSKDNPFLLKPGGLALCFGGFALSAFGLIEVAADVATSDIVGFALSAIAFATGIYVMAAGLLTYQGGIYETAGYNASPFDEKARRGWTDKLLHPKNGLLPRFFESVIDRPIEWFNQRVVKPGIFWVPARIKSEQPFATSMWARLPWRLVTGGFAFVSGTPQGMAFGFANLCWAIGDVSIGALDWDDE